MKKSKKEADSPVKGKLPPKTKELLEELSELMNDGEEYTW